MAQYADKTFDAILQQSLNELPDDIDKRPGSSLAYDAMAPFSQRMEEAYIDLDNTLEMVFGDTAPDEWLDKCVAEVGLTRKPATYTIRHVQTTGTGAVKQGELVAVGDDYFTFAQDATIPSVVPIRAVESGSVIPAIDAKVIPINTVVGLATISLIAHEDDADGTNIESDDALRSRYLLEKQRNPSSGNIADYEKWALEVPGVGAVIVVPRFRGGETVKLVILDANGNPASEKLCEQVKQEIDPVTGEGRGKAPIGAEVEVVPATLVDVSVAADIELDGTRDIADVQADVETALRTYSQAIKLGTGGEITYNRVGGLIIRTDGVHDYRNLTVNGGTADIPLTGEQVPRIGAVTLNVV